MRPWCDEVLPETAYYSVTMELLGPPSFRKKIESLLCWNRPIGILHNPLVPVSCIRTQSRSRCFNVPHRAVRLPFVRVFWSAFVTNGTKPSTGWRMNGTKYVVLRELDGPVLYLKRVSRISLGHKRVLALHVVWKSETSCWNLSLEPAVAFVFLTSRCWAIKGHPCCEDVVVFVVCIFIRGT